MKLNFIQIMGPKVLSTGDVMVIVTLVKPIWFSHVCSKGLHIVGIPVEWLKLM